MRSERLLHRVALGALFLAAYAWFLPPRAPEMFGTNNAVRFYFAKSLALDGSFAIERYYRGGIDAAFFRGHFYSGKAPAASFLAVPALRIAAAAGAASDRALLYLARLLVVSVPSVLMILALHGFLLRLGVPDGRADLLAAAYGLGTMAFPYSTEFVGHQLAAVLLFGCFVNLARWRRVGGECRPGPATGRNGGGAASASDSRRSAGGPPRRFSPLLMAGLFAGMSVAADYQTALIAAILFLFLARPLRLPSGIAAFALGCLPGAALVLWYNRACFGSVWSFPYAHEAMPIAREVQGQGLFGVMAPRLAPLGKLLFSPWRGVFFGSPFLLLAVPGLLALRRAPRGEGGAGVGPRRLAALCLCICGGYLLFNSSYGAWSGGAGYGPRFLVPAIPFFVLAAAGLFVREPRGAGPLLLVLAALSMAFHFVGTAAGPSAHEYLRNPVREFLLPSLLRGNVRPNWASEAGWPPAAAVGALAALLLLLYALARLAGDRAPRRAPRACGSAEKLLLALCAAGAVAMAALFVFHGTEETAYRYGVLGHSYDVAGDPDAAIPLFEKSLAMDPRDERVAGDLTRILAARRDYRRAFEANARALASRPGDRGLEARAAALARLCAISDELGAGKGDPALAGERDSLLAALGLPGAEGAKR